MKVSKDTIDVLKGFSAINQSIMLKKGKLQRTVCPEKFILAEVELVDEFPIDFGVYDLNQFLATISEMNDPELKFSPNHVIMKNESDEWELKYGSCAPNTIKLPPDKSLIMDKIDVTFDMTSSMIEKITRLSQINTWSSMQFIGKDNKIILRASDTSNPDTGSLSKTIASYKGVPFEATLKVANLKLIPEDYTVEIMLNGYTKFSSKTSTLKYFISLEASKD